ncbi:unnamed protein product [Lactuca virosa]|uniref:Defensin-like protein n=1 Tax=Lactuca virosa TaxID=75947 RepID=A0AAU9NV80_9ASTR|nr:unnamed protein product [Lactuca virosa]
MSIMKLVNMYAILLILITISIATKASIATIGDVNTNRKINIKFCHTFSTMSTGCQDGNCNDYCRDLKGKFAYGKCFDPYTCDCQYVC